MDPETRSRVSGHLTKADGMLESARLLAGAGQVDNSISRAYYAAYHAARAALAALGLTPRTHDGLVSLFGARLVQTGKIDRSLGRALNRLQADRENGDYGLDTFFSPEDSREAIQHAEALLAAVRGWLATEFGSSFVRPRRPDRKRS